VRDNLADDTETIWLDRGYDNGAVRRQLADAGIDDVVIARCRKPGQTTIAVKVPMRLRWPIEPPTRGSRTSASSAPRPTAGPSTDSPNSLWPSSSSSPPSSSTGGTGSHRVYTLRR
jgi:hypothetical protein